ncbi:MULTISPECIES: hypothetical protein [Shewanella]|jgi:uncharacterized membrane protein|uniref:hypothetical protein n=1 Tax=Shewanella TaxID=22 RepID=UPI000C5BD6E0|nr:MULTISPECIES: hypothetical protein [Shewanella]NCQ46834.1 hypothetical protein [Shewanella frigidimarina]MBB1392088.1 hypothetical protein [Shewanella sp. SG44-6]NCO73283.1 hypothetical protein [Shewanella vesiculosa]NCP38473.1 hypothetical protein [Shewanella vesiculosa]NCP71434.1 hypothetical protein [Shewanella vesiculosa]
MNPATMALLIPILAILGSFIVSIMKLRERQARATTDQATNNKALHDEISALRKRIEVLERVVTEDAYDLKQKINNA